MSEKIILEGIATSQGVAEGKAKIVAGIQDAGKFKDGDILVTKITDPTMVAMMSQASAIVCDIGGMTSHPSIISREMGIPCVVGTKEATDKLTDGMMIKVDGSEGKVYRLNQ